MWTGLGPAVTLALVLVVAWATELKPTAPPIFTGRPFVVAWDVPTQDCGPRHKMPLDPSLKKLRQKRKVALVEVSKSHGKCCCIDGISQQNLAMSWVC